MLTVSCVVPETKVRLAGMTKVVFRLALIKTKSERKPFARSPLRKALYPTSRIPHPTTHPRHPRRAALAARSGIQTESPTRDLGAGN